MQRSKKVVVKPRTNHRSVHPHSWKHLALARVSASFPPPGAGTNVRSSTRALRLIIESEDPIFPGMKKIKIQGKDLSQVPAELFHLVELEVLDMSPEREACLYYKLTEVPPAVGRLVNLRVLILDTNDLRVLPPEIGLLSRLERLILSNNLLTHLPREFSNLKQLQSLHLANNKLHTFPEVLCQLKSLEYLDMCDNRLESIPPSIKNLMQLQSLLLFQNRLQRLPEVLCDLIQLRCLWLGNNNLTSLPRGMGNLKLLDWAWHYTSTTLDGNPLRHPPLNICKMGTERIAEYFAAQRSTSPHSRPRRDGSPELLDAFRSPSEIWEEQHRVLRSPSPSSRNVLNEDIVTKGDMMKDPQRHELGFDPRTMKAIRRGASPLPIHNDEMIL